MKKNIKYSILIVLVMLLIFLGYQMFTLWQMEMLWGKLPLLFFTALWGLYLLIFEKRFGNRRWLVLSTLSGILLTLGFPTIPLTFLMFVGFVPLLILEQEISQKQAGTSKMEVFKYSYHAFVTWNILTTWWVANTAFLASFFAFWVNALFMTISFVAFHVAKKRLPKLSYLAFIAFWLTFEYIHLRWEISWTWLTLGNAFAEFPSWVQWYEYTGVFGGGVWILGANVLIFKCLQKDNNTIEVIHFFKLKGIDVAKVLTLIVVPIGISLWMYSNYEEQGKPVEVVVVQPNYEPHYVKFRTPNRLRVEQHLQLSEQAVTENTAYLVFPETSFSQLRTDDLASDRDLKAFNRFLAAYPKLKLVTGIGGINIFEKGEPHSHAVREHTYENGKTIYYEALNAAIQLPADSSEIPLYIKSKLVPGAEFIPYRALFFWIEPLVDHLDGSLEGHGTQPDRETFTSDKGEIAPVICYESIYGEYHTSYIQDGAEAIFIMTNDGWWDDSPGHKQHLKFAALRAIETRKSVARSANTGVSAFLNQRGDILQPTKYGEEAAIRGTILFNDKLTFYVKYGDLIGRLGAFAAALLILNMIAKIRLSKLNTAQKIN